MVMVTLSFIAAAFGAAVFAGFLGALFGIGGGIIIVPFLTAFMGIPIHEGIAISIVSVIATSNAGGSAYVDQRITNIQLGMYLEIATTSGALVGAFVALLLKSWELYLIFVALLLYMAFTSIRTSKTDEARIRRGDFAKAKQGRVAKYLNLSGSYYDHSEKMEVEYVVTKARAGALVSSLAGIISGLLGVGGGIIKVAAMNLFMNVPIKAAVATSKFMIGVTAVTSALLFFLAGFVNPYLIAPVALGTTAGATIGTWVMPRTKSSVLKVAFAILVISLAYVMLAQGLALGFNIHLPSTG